MSLSLQKRCKRLVPLVMTLAIALSACSTGRQYAEPDVPYLPQSQAVYVDSRLGSDQNSGTSPERPWKTFENVNAKEWGPNDRILLRAGSRFRGQLILRGSGSKGYPVLVDQYDRGASPRIDARGDFPEAILLENGEYWTIANLEITNTGSEREAGRSGVRVRLQDFGDAHGITLRNLYVHDVNGSLVKREGGGTGILCENRRGDKKSRFDGLLIENCEIVRTDRDGIILRSQYAQRESWHPNLNVVIRGNRLRDIGGDGIVPWACDGAIVEYNILKDGRTRCEDYAAGIWPWSSDNTIIQYNEVSGMKGTKDGQGFDSDWNSRNTVIQYNYSHDNDGGFLLICNKGDAAPSRSVGNQGTIVRFNISQNDGARLFQISGPVENTRIYNNTLYVREGMQVKAVEFRDWEGWAKDTLFTNNVFLVDGEASFDLGQSQGTVFTNNVYHGNFENLPPDTDPLRMDPLFVRPGAGRSGRETLTGYQLQPGSPLIGAGLPVIEPGKVDFFGNPVTDWNAMPVGAHYPFTP